MTLYAIAQRRSFFQRLLEQTGDVGRFFSSDEKSKAKISKIKKLDQMLREESLNHGVEQKSLRQDLIAAEKALLSNDLFEANRQLMFFNNSLINIVSISNSVLEEDNQLLKRAGEFEDIYSEQINPTKVGLQKILAEAKNIYQFVIKPIFTFLDHDRAKGDVNTYLHHLNELISTCKNFTIKYNEFYMESMSPYFELKHKHKSRLPQAGRKIRKTLEEMTGILPSLSEGLQVEEYKSCPCGSGKNFIACHGESLYWEKIKDFMPEALSDEEKEDQIINGGPDFEKAKKIFFNWLIAEEEGKRAYRESLRSRIFEPGLKIHKYYFCPCGNGSFFIKCHGKSLYEQKIKEFMPQHMSDEEKDNSISSEDENFKKAESKFFVWINLREGRNEYNQILKNIVSPIKVSMKSRKQYFKYINS